MINTPGRPSSKYPLRMDNYITAVSITTALYLLEMIQKPSDTVNSSTELEGLYWVML